MTLPTNPPPVKIPQALLTDPEVRGFFTRLVRDIYQIWAKTGGGTVIGVAEGGTGASTAAGARTNLSVYSTTEVDTISELDRRYALLVS